MLGFFRHINLRVLSFFYEPGRVGMAHQGFKGAKNKPLIIL